MKYPTVLMLGSLIVMVAKAGEVSPPDGLYRIDVALEIPHVDTRDYGFSETICLGPTSLDRLGPLGPGPLRSCPRELHGSGSELQVSVRCEGPNTARASGSYRLTDTGFRGVVNMNMGGKNMTLVERQKAVRLGPCPNTHSD